MKLAQEVLAGQAQPGGELGALQRTAQAAAEPLIALGQSAASTALGYLGSSTAVALTSGLGVLRLGLGEPFGCKTTLADGPQAGCGYLEW